MISSKSQGSKVVASQTKKEGRNGTAFQFETLLTLQKQANQQIDRMITMGARIKKRKDSSEKDELTSQMSKAEEMDGHQNKNSQGSIKSLKNGDINNTQFARRGSSKALLGNQIEQSARRNHYQNHSPHKSASFVKEGGSTAMMNSDSTKQI